MIIKLWNTNQNKVFLHLFIIIILVFYWLAYLEFSFPFFVWGELCGSMSHIFNTLEMPRWLKMNLGVADQGCCVVAKEAGNTKHNLYIMVVNHTQHQLLINSTFQWLGRARWFRFHHVQHTGHGALAQDAAEPWCSRAGLPSSAQTCGGGYT